VNAAGDDARVHLTLFVAGASDLSARAIADARGMCETHLEGEYRLSVVDLSENSGAPDQVAAAPMLVRNQPLPERRIVGDLSDARKVLVALDLERS
jgi:circadian clock protein KaiB